MAEKCIERIPSYFYKVGASSTGKYHPKFASGEGGLYRHTIAACMILESLFELAPYDSLSTLGRDTARLAVMLHDTCKSGMSDKEYASNKHTRFEHPMLPRALYGDLVKEWNGLGSGIIENVDGMSDLLFCAIESHMGKWNVSKYSAHVLPKPNEYDNPRSNTILNMLVHLADYLASRNFIDVVFE